MLKIENCDISNSRNPNWFEKTICYLDVFFWIQNWWPLKSAQPYSRRPTFECKKVLWRDKVRASFSVVSFYLPLSLTNLKLTFNQVAEQQHMPGDCGWLGSLSTFFQQIIHQAAVTQLFRHFNGRDRLLKCWVLVFRTVDFFGKLLCHFDFGSKGRPWRGGGQHKYVYICIFI